jgi:hypothetical protein
VVKDEKIWGETVLECFRDFLIRKEAVWVTLVAGQLIKLVYPSISISDLSRADV